MYLSGHYHKGKYEYSCYFTAQIITFLHRFLAEQRGKGIVAGPIIADYLNNPYWDIRVAAARAIGFIGFQRANPSLIRFLANEEDWQLVWASVEALGQASGPRSSGRTSEGSQLLLVSTRS